MSSQQYVAQEMKKLRLIFGGHCKKCGGKKQLEFAHLALTQVAGKGRGSKHRMLDIKRNKDKYELLCRSCHRLRDRRARELRLALQLLDQEREKDRSEAELSVWETERD